MTLTKSKLFSIDPLFLNIGITLEVLSKVGKIPISKDLLIRVAIGLAISSFRSLSILTGILRGPADFVSEKESTTLKTSSVSGREEY